MIEEQVIEELRELIDALDRRLPRVERLGEAAIARDAAALRADAERRIVQIEREVVDNAVLVGVSREERA